MVKFQEYNTSDTVVEFVARNNDYPLKSGLVLVCSFVCCIFFTSVRIPAIIISFFVLYSLWNTVVEESITVIKEFGIQIKSKYLFSFSENVLFLHHDKIDGQLLQECIVGNSVRFYLSFIVSGENSVTVVFKDVYPGLSALQKIYNTLSPSFTEGSGRSRRHNN